MNHEGIVEQLLSQILAAIDALNDELRMQRRPRSEPVRIANPPGVVSEKHNPPPKKLVDPPKKLVDPPIPKAPPKWRPPEEL